MYEERYVRPEDEAINNILKSFGYRNKSMKKISHNRDNKDNRGGASPMPVIASSQNDNLSYLGNSGEQIRQDWTSYKFEYENKVGLKTFNIVYAMNIFSQNRKRKSIIINLDNDACPFLLVAIGPEKSMKSVLTTMTNRKEYNKLKMLYTKQKQKGLKVIIVAKKPLTFQTVTHYMKEHTKITKSARDQIDDLERLAMQMEVDMEFVGCFGLRDNIKEDAIQLTKELQKVNMPISIMSGDDLENCLNVTQKLHMKQIDIQNSSTFFGIRLMTEKGVMQEIRRIFDIIHDTLQTESLYSMESLTKHEQEPGAMNRKFSDAGGILDQAQKQKLQQVADGKGDEELQIVLSPEQKLDSLRRPLLISGDSLEVVMKSSSLTNHLKSIIMSTSNLVAFDLRPKHKAFLVDMLRQTGQTVMAIGDGFNDIGMLAKANVGIQISSSKVPLIFGDIVVPKLNQIGPLLFNHGFRLQKNLIMAFFILVYLVTFIMILPVITIYFTYCTPAFATDVRGYLSFGMNLEFPVITCFAVLNYPYTNKLIQCFPSIYKENRYLAKNAYNLFIISFVWAVLEGLALIFLCIYFVGSDLNSAGYPSSFDTVLGFYSLFNVVNVVIKTTLLFSSPSAMQIILPLVCLLFEFVASLLIILFAKNGTAIGSGGLVYFSDYIYGMAILTIAFTYSSYIIINACKHMFFHRCGQLLKQLSRYRNEPIIHFAKNERMLEFVQSFTKYVDDAYLHMIHLMKKPFKTFTSMDHTLRRIVNIDFYNSNMGLSKITNSIVDEDERKKFSVYLSKILDMSALRILFVCLLVAAVFEWVIASLTKRYYYPALFDSLVPYYTLALIALILIHRFKPKLIHHAIMGKESCYRFSIHGFHDNHSSDTFGTSWRSKVCQQHDILQEVH